MHVAHSQGSEGLPCWRRDLPVVFVDGTPATGDAAGLQPAGVIDATAACQRSKGLASRRRGLAIAVKTPAQHAAVGFKSARVAIPGGQRSKRLPNGRRCCAVRRLTPANRCAVVPQAAGVVRAFHNPTQRFTRRHGRLTISVVAPTLHLATGLRGADVTEPARSQYSGTVASDGRQWTSRLATDVAPPALHIAIRGNSAGMPFPKRQRSECLTCGSKSGTVQALSPTDSQAIRSQGAVVVSIRINCNELPDRCIENTESVPSPT